MTQFILEIIFFLGIFSLSLIFILLFHREKFFHKHIRLACLSIWFLLTIFAIMPIVLQQYTSITNLIGVITFSIITIHTTLPVPRSWTIIMALITSFIHFMFVIRSHNIQDPTNKSQLMEYKLEVELILLGNKKRKRKRKKENNYRFAWFMRCCLYQKFTMYRKLTKAEMMDNKLRMKVFCFKI